MKKRVLLMAAIASLLGASCSDSQPRVNPLLEAKWETPHQTPPFSEILTEDFVPAITEQIAEAKTGVQSIVNQRSIPTFENTIVALERVDDKLSRTIGVLFNLNSTVTTPELQEVVMKVTPMLTEYGNDVSLNPALFDRVKQVYDRREQLNLDVEDAMLLENTYKSFSRSGANLSQEDKEKYRKISSELAELKVKFDQNELAATNAFTLNITEEADLAGLPEFVVEGAAAEAKAKGVDGWVITLQAPSYMPFMKYADSRELREKLWKTRGSLCASGDENDNQQIVKRTAELRLELANLLGYPTYADYALERRMAISSENVQKFLAELLDKTIEYARDDVKLIANYAKENGFEGELMPWDYSYWDEKYVTEKFQINDEMTKPYFKLEDAEQALFMLADRLWGLKFKENKELPIYHPDVVAYEVYDKNGDFLSVLYCDYFPRQSKNSGAWMNSFRDASIGADSVEVRPIVVLVNNFTKPTETKPSLLSFGEFETMLHEFGHGIHGILGKGKYSSLTGTSVYRDFVELPSQVLENWALEKEYLDLFAKHYETGEKMPEELIEKLIASGNHLSAYLNVNQVRYATLDMAWHSITEPVDISVEEFEKSATKGSQILPSVEGVFMSPSFGHIFAGGYAAGYYSYKWAEVLDADAFSKFKAAGIFDPEVAESFRRNILEKGGTEHPMTLYVRFAGSEPTIEPLIERMGLEKK